jgi:hypothetical protein
MVDANSEYIEELLSNYIDDELSDRERNEAKRLIAHDAEIKHKFEQLRKIKVLLNLAPKSDIPSHILENIKTQIERQVLLGEHPQQRQVWTGRKYLVVRRALTAAAIIVLVAALAWVIMGIMVPGSKSATPVARNHKTKADKKVFYEKPVFTDSGTTENIVPAPDKQTDPFYARLELTTAKAATVDAFISKMILNSDMFELITSVDRQPGNIRYSIKCGRKDVNKLLAQMIPAWDRCENVQLSVAGETINSFVTINNVSIAQAMDVFTIDQLRKRSEIVKQMADLNQITQPGEHQKIFANDLTAVKNLLRPSKPVLTTASRPAASLAKPEITEPVNLTIIVR